MDRLLLQFLLGLAVACLASACYQTQIALTVRPDGSGTVVVTMTTTKAGLAQIRAEGENKYRAMTDDEILTEFFSWEDSSASGWIKDGKSVKFEKRSRTQAGDTFHLIKTFSFTDIRRVQPSTSLFFQQGVNQHDFATFDFAPGEPATLFVTIPWRKGEPDTEKEEAASDTELEKDAKKLLDLRTALVVNIDGTVSKSDATFQDGNRVTLLDLKSADIYGDAKRLRKLQSAQTWPDAAKVLDSMPGNKAEPKAKVEIQFAGPH